MREVWNVRPREEIQSDLTDMRGSTGVGTTVSPESK